MGLFTGSACLIRVFCILEEEAWAEAVVHTVKVADHASYKIKLTPFIPATHQMTESLLGPLRSMISGIANLPSGF